MKKNYFLIVGILILLLVGGYFGVHKFLGNGDETVDEKIDLDIEENAKHKKNELLKEIVSEKSNHSDKNINLSSEKTGNGKIKFIKNNDDEVIDINFYSNNGVLLSTFNLKENNPFLSKFNTVKNEKRLYKPEKEINYAELLNGKDESFDYLKISTHLPHITEDINITIIPISYSCVFMNKDTGAIHNTSVLYQLDKNGSIESKMISSGTNSQIQISKNGRYILYNNTGITNQYEQNVTEGHGYEIIDIENPSNELKKYFNENSKTRITGASFLGNNIFGEGYDDGRTFYLLIDLENNKKYIKYYEIDKVNASIDGGRVKFKNLTTNEFSFLDDPKYLYK